MHHPSREHDVTLHPPVVHNKGMKSTPSNIIKPALVAHLAIALATLTGLSGQAEDASSSQKIHKVAQKCVDKEMWHGYGLPSGYFGCAAAVCNVLKLAGIDGVSTALVTGMRKQLLQHKSGAMEMTIRNGQGREIDNATMLKYSHPGDILLAFKQPPTKTNGGANAHCGIMGSGTTVYSNYWNNGLWTKCDVHQMFDAYPYVRLVRLGVKTAPAK